MTLYVPVESSAADAASGGAFQIIKAARGLKEPRMAEAIVKLKSIARNVWRRLIFNPSNGASIELSSALPKVVRRMIRGNLIAT